MFDPQNTNHQFSFLKNGEDSIKRKSPDTGLLQILQPHCPHRYVAMCSANAATHTGRCASAFPQVGWRSWSRQCPTGLVGATPLDEGTHQTGGGQHWECHYIPVPL